MKTIIDWRIFCFILFVFGYCPVFIGCQASEAAQQTVIHTTLNLFDEQRQRPLRVDLWYQIKSDSLCTDTTIDSFPCHFAHRPDTTVVVFTHGTMGAALGYTWLTEALAAKGMLVVGLNHYGESWIYGQESIVPAMARKVWQRPMDVSFVLDQLSTKPQLKNLFNFQQVIGIGHSSGGGTIAALLGGEFSFDGGRSYCRQEASKNDKSCLYLQGKYNTESIEYPPQTDYSDSRITEAILLDPALGPLITSASLQQLEQPVQIFALRNSDFLSMDGHALHYAKNLLNSEIVWLGNNAGHFVFLNDCDLALEEFGVSLCIDRDDVNRDQTHQQILAEITEFLDRNHRLTD